MCYRILIIAIILLICNIGCSSLEQVTFCPSINQGRYISYKDISRISLGMTQQQIVHILGTPIIIDPFNHNTWFYIFYQLSKRRIIMQQILLLNFNNKGILISINNNFMQ